MHKASATIKRGTFFKTLIFFVFFSALLLSIKILIVESFLFRAEYLIQQIEKKKIKSKEAVIKKALKAIDYSIVFDNKNERSHLLKADLLARLFLQESLNNSDKRLSYYNASLNSYEKALELRPHWGYAWARLASLYNSSPNKKNLISKIRNSLFLSVFLSPYEDDTQRIMIPILLEHHDFLNSNKNDIFSIQARSVIKHALKNYSNNKLVFTLAEKYNRLTFLESIITLQRNKKKLKKIREKERKKVSN